MEKLTEKERKMALERLAAGVGPTRVARELNGKVSRQYLEKLKKKLRAPAPAEFDLNATRRRFLPKACNAVEDALDCREDLYKRGNMGATVLKGLGVFSPDQINQAAIIVANLPIEVRELCARYAPLPASVAESELSRESDN